METQEHQGAIFMRPYKTRRVARRYGYVDGRFRKITKFDYEEFIRMKMKIITFSKPNINGWDEILVNGFGATIAFKMVSK